AGRGGEPAESALLGGGGGGPVCRCDGGAAAAVAGPGFFRRRGGGLSAWEGGRGAGGDATGAGGRDEGEVKGAVIRRRGPHSAPDAAGQAIEVRYKRAAPSGATVNAVLPDSSRENPLESGRTGNG